MSKLGSNINSGLGIELGSMSDATRNAGVSTALGTIIYNSTSNSIEGYGPEGWIEVKSLVNNGMSASGGIVADYVVGDTAYRSHTFLAPGSFKVSDLGNIGSTVDILCVAGGGGGGGGQVSNEGSGGGGAGGMRVLPGLPVAVDTYAVTIGEGGNGGYHPVADGIPGTNSTIAYADGTVVATGGGGGRTYPTGGNNGGSGGGGQEGPPSGATVASPDGISPTSQGNPGGNGGTNSGGGGGGAGTAGSNATSGSAGGAGGDGLANVYRFGPSNPITYAGGGGGAGYPGPGAAGGPGGGGAGAPSAPGNGTPASKNTGSGGGGGAADTSGGRGGDGAPGIVVVRYQIGVSEAVAPGAKATGGTISKVGSRYVHVFTEAGTFNAPTPLNPTPLSVTYFMVGGGGSGGSDDGGGGGGAGGVMTNIPGIIPAPGTGGAMALTPGTNYPITIGAGGGVTYATFNPFQGNDGTPTTFNSITAGGGGGGAGSGPPAPNGRNGLPGNGSGGGAGASGGSVSNGGVGSGVGSNGGGTWIQNWQGCGGGGAGGSVPGPAPGQGGPGVQLPTAYHDPTVAKLGAENPSGPSWGWFAGGGGGGGGDGTSPPIQGGVGGGGQGESNDTPQNAGNGLSGTGGGGGGKDIHDNSPVTTPASGRGGSGIVIVSYTV